jgi:hypothetical protein
MRNIFHVAAEIVNSLEFMYRADRGAMIWGRMHSSAGMVPATIKKIGANRWQVIPRIKNPLKAKEEHPGFSWFYNDIEAYQWIKANAYAKQPRA